MDDGGRAEGRRQGQTKRRMMEDRGLDGWMDK